MPYTVQYSVHYGGMILIQRLGYLCGNARVHKIRVFQILYLKLLKLPLLSALKTSLHNIF